MHNAAPFGGRLGSSGDDQMPKLRKLDIVMAGAFLAFLFAWHFRADFVEIGRVAASVNAALTLEHK